MPGRNERNCQIRMSPTLWNLVGEIAQELGYKDARGRHSTVIREMIAAAAAKWAHSPYICRSARHTVYVTQKGEIFARQVEILRLNSPREKLPCFVEMKPEKRDYYHNTYRISKPKEDEQRWFQEKWMLNHFSVWSGKKDASDLEAFKERPLSSDVDSFGTTYKKADLAVRAVGGRFLTREIIVGLRDYVQWKEFGTPIFDRLDLPIDIPTSDLQVCVVVDLRLFSNMDISEDEIANLALEFRNRESARFDGKEVALYPEVRFSEKYGRSPDDDGTNDAQNKVRRLWLRVSHLLETKTTEGKEIADQAKKEEINSCLVLPERFLFYELRWPSPHLGIEVCVRWEKPVRGEK